MLTDDEKSELLCRECWTLNEFGYLLAGRTADQSQPRNELTNKAIDEVKSAIGNGTLAPIPGQEPGGLIYGWVNIRPVDAIRWAQSKPKFWCFHKTFPDFSEYLESMSGSSSAKTMALEKSSVEQSAYWCKLRDLASLAIDSFPAWQEKQNTIQKSGNLQEWLVKEIKADTRESEILKKILTEVFNLR